VSALKPIVRRLPLTATRHARDEAGDSLIEVLMAALIAALVIGGLALSFASGNDSSLAAQRESVLVEAANQQMENIHQLIKANGFSDLGLNITTTALDQLQANASTAKVKFDRSTPLDPNSFITSCGSTPAYQIENNYDNTSDYYGTTSSPLISSLPLEAPCTTAGYEPLVNNGVVPQTSSVTVGSMTITLDDYVTDTSVGCNTSLGGGSCTGDARRVIVVAVDSQAQSRCSSATTTNRCSLGADAPVYLSTIFTNPTPSNAPNSSIGITLGVQLG
jgi:hypothetical protein